MTNIYKSIIFICLICFSQILITQKTASLIIGEHEIEIVKLFDSIRKTDDIKVKEEINLKILNLFNQVLILDQSFFYPFDSIKSVGKFTSSDEKLKIITWNFPYQDGTHKYFGFVLYKPDNDKNHVLYCLEDKSENMTDIENSYLDNESWFGALYYEIISVKLKHDNYYILLGFDFNDLFISKKIIEVLYFDNETQLHFGKPVFKYNNGIQNRIVFEYSSRIKMSLKYNMTEKIIVYDHLSPAKPIYTGKYQFYGPDFTYDALKMDGEFWNVEEDIDVRNELY